MLNISFKDKFPFAYNYFSTLLELVFEGKRKFPQAIIFEGADTKAQYLFSLELARLLNCSQEKGEFCKCTNCKWVRSFAHPAVNNVSQIHFKGEGDETKTMISIKQAREIEKTLMLSSDYHRFFIFFSSKEHSYNPDEFQDFQKLGYCSEINFSIEPLNSQVFGPNVANALLKSVEEPPERTTFIFLVKSKEDILPTIVSRCQTFKLNGQINPVNYDKIINILPSYPINSYCDAIETSDKFLNILKENDFSFEELLNEFIAYLKDLMKNNLDNEPLCEKIKIDTKIINEAIAHRRANVSEKTVLEALFLRLKRGY